MRALLSAFLLPLVLVICVSGSPFPQDQGTQGNDEAQLNGVLKPSIYYLHVQSDIKHRYAKTKIISRVANPANISQEVKFEMVLPKTAFITGFSIQVKDKTYVSQILEKKNAEEVYNAAVSAGLTTGQVNVKARESNEFYVSLNIESRGKVGFQLTYEELITRTLGQYNYVVNLNPRQFVNDLLVNVSIYETSGIKDVMVPELKISNELSEEPEVENKLVKIERLSNNHVQVLYQPTAEQQKEVKDDDFRGQLIVRYDVERPSQGGEVLVNEGYFVHFFSPKDLPILPKYLVFVLDVSGSMYGRKMDQVKDAMKKIFDEMREVDFFSILDFSYTATVHDLDDSSSNISLLPEDPQSFDTSKVSSKVYPASKENIEKAKKIINDMTPGGGTNIYSALQTALIVGQQGIKIVKKDQNVEPIIIFLTDGEATVGNTNQAQIRSMVKELNLDPRIILYSLAFGFEPDIQFLKKLSLANSGFARSIYPDSDATLQLTDFYKEIASPLISNVTFSYLPGQVDNTTLTSYNFPVLFEGSELIVAGMAVDNKIQGSVEGHSVSSSQVFQALESRDIPDDITQILYTDGDAAYAVDEKVEKNTTYGTLERLWAYLTINNLLDKKDISTDTNETAELTSKAMKLALKYKFVTPLTSLVVVKPNETEEVIAAKEQGPVSGDRYGLIYAAPLPAPSSAGFSAGFPGQAGPMAGSFNSFQYTTRLSMPPSFLMKPTLPAFPTMSPSLATTMFVSKMDSGPFVFIDWAQPDETVLLPNSTEPLKILAPPTNDNFGTCEILTDPKSEGLCVHIMLCSLPEAIETKEAFLPYFCPVVGGYLGMCCPEDKISKWP